MKLQPDLLLPSLLGGPFDEAARILLPALALGARVIASPRAVPSRELADTYALRLRRLEAKGRTMPGLDLVTELFVTHPATAWWLLGIDDPEHGGVIVVSADDEKLVGCFAYNDSRTGNSSDL